MGPATSVTPLPVSANSAQLAVTDTDFDTRWAAWMARGRVHDQRVQRRVLILCSAIAIGTAIALALFRP
jgi:hypothetical protein